MLTRRLRYWLGSAKREAALRAEMELHLEEKTAEMRDRGLPEAEARAEARRRFGNFGLKQEESREIWIARYWWDFWQDLRYGARSLRHNPAFAAVGILSAAFGIGACSTIFSMVNFAVFRPLPVAEPQSLMSVTAIHLKQGDAGQTMSFPEIEDLRNQTRSWRGVAAFAPLLSAGIRPEGGEARRYSGFLVTGNYFDVVKPEFAAGGGFIHGEDDVPGASAKIVLTHALWVSQFRADRGIVGRTIQVNKRAMTVVGVTGAGFRGTGVGIAADFFLPFSQLSEMRRLGENPGRMTSYGAQWLMGVGRTALGVDLRQAQAELDSVAYEIRNRVPEMANDRGFNAERAGQLMPRLRSLAIPALLLLLAVTFLVLLAACANVANLMLARASARSKEIATRLAIGAGRGRLVRQLMTESALLAFGGGALGVALASLAGRYIAELRLPVPVPVDLSVPVDYRVLLFSVALSAITAIAFGLAPAFRGTRPNLMLALRSDNTGFASLRRVGLRNALVVAQIAISAMLVICAGLFLRSLGAARAIDSGMDTKNLALVRFDPSLIAYDEKQTHFLLLETLRDTAELPGVRSATVTNLLPLSFGGNFTGVGAEGRSEPDQLERTAVMAVGPRYFETMGIPLLAGVDFRPAASNETVVIVNQDLAGKLFPHQEAIGQRIIDGGRAARIVAVVANSKHEQMLQSGTVPILYRPILDAHAGNKSVAGLTLIVKTAQDPAAMGNAIRQMLLKREPELVVTLAGSMDLHIQGSLFVPRLAASLFGVCGGMGLLIASIGVYGVINFAVARRAREIGIRMALGARRSQVLKMMLWHGTSVALVGIAIGLTGGLAMARAARSLIYGVSSTDPVTFISVPVLLLAVTLLATAIPARRAARLDPNRTLRAE